MIVPDIRNDREIGISRYNRNSLTLDHSIVILSHPLRTPPANAR
jgi:hypothetical protein